MVGGSKAPEHWLLTAMQQRKKKNLTVLYKTMLKNIHGYIDSLSTSKHWQNKWYSSDKNKTKHTIKLKLKINLTENCFFFYISIYCDITVTKKVK